MANLKDEYNRIITDIKKAISDDKEREIVIEKVNELSGIYADRMEDMQTIIDVRIKQLQDNEEYLGKTVRQLHEAVKDLENDIYNDGIEEIEIIDDMLDDVDEGEYDFEIVCPYCNVEFVVDLSKVDDNFAEIKCPECKNIIELDWNDEEDEAYGCQGGGCSSCHGCGPQIYFEDYNNSNDDNNNEDDDM